MYKIALVEDNLINQRDFAAKIRNFKELELVFICSSGSEFLEKTTNFPIEKLPDVVFMDLKMEGYSGPETIKLSKLHENKMQFIVYTVFDDDSHIFEAIKSGAVGYLLKHESAENIYQCVVETIENGGSGISPSIARKALELLAKQENTTTENSLINKKLTQKEKEILELLVKGLDAKRIAQTLHSNTLTIRKHIANVYKKLHINSKAQIISLAHKEKWFK